MMQIVIPAGQSIELDNLERDKEYMFEIKVLARTFSLNVG